mgnify:CR=1 FL=1
MLFQKINKILVIRTDRIGDVVLTTPVFKALRNAYPAAHIAVLVTPVTVDLVRGNPYIDDVIIDDRNGVNRGLIGSLKLARTIRQHHFDMAIIYHTKRRYNLTCYLAGIPARIGFKNDKFGFLLTHPCQDERFKGERHEAQYCLDVLKAVGIEDAGLEILIPTQKEGEQWAAAWFNDNNLLPGELIAIHPGASDTTRLWPSAHFAALIDALAIRYAVKIVLIGGKETSGTAQEIMRLSKAPALDVTGKTTVAQTASLLRRCRLLISNDSGPLHIGAGVGIYVICLFLRNQPGINPTRWRPLGLKAHMLTNKPGEEIMLDDKGKIKSGRLDSITVDDALGLVEEIFVKNSQSMFYW